MLRAAVIFRGMQASNSSLRRPRERYQADLQKPGFSYDAAQELAVEKLDDLYERLLAPSE